MVHTGDGEANVVGLNTAHDRHEPAHDDDLVAQADHANRSLSCHRSGQARHRIGDVQQPRVRTQTFHVAGDVDEHGDVAQRTRDPSGTDGVAHRLTDPVAGGDLEVVRHRREAAGRDGDDDVVGTLQRRVAVDCRLDGGLGVDLVGHCRAYRSIGSSDAPSMSWRTMSASASDGVVRMSVTSFGPHCRLPPPTITIRIASPSASFRIRAARGPASRAARRRHAGRRGAGDSHRRGSASPPSRARRR